MKKFIKVQIFALISILFFISCSKNEISITDIIPSVNLISGKTDSVVISDLFYSPDYDINLLANEKVKTDFNKNNLALIFSPAETFSGYTTVEFSYDGRIYSIPVYVKNIQSYEFIYETIDNNSTVNLIGSFNSWDRHNLRMIDSDNNGKYKISIPLEPGRYEYKFVVNGKETLDPLNKDVVANDIGGTNSLITITEKSKKIFLHKSNYEKKSDYSELQFILQMDENKFIENSNITALLDNSKIYPENILIDQNKVSVRIPNEDLIKSKMLRVVISFDELVSNIQVIPINNGKPTRQDPQNWYDGIIYSLMIDRFYDGDKTNDSPVIHDSLSWKANYMGGDFSGIIKKIQESYFDSLGINVLWISPVYDNPNEAYREYPEPHRWFSGYHGYWPVHQEKVEEKFGSFNDLKLLVKTAHEHKLKVLLDFVSHHVHIEHPFFTEHKEWFGQLDLPDGRLNLRLWDEYRLTTWFEPYLPSFDFVKSKEAAEVMSDNAIWWLNNTGADGFRHDAVKHVPNSFWRTLTKKIKEKIENVEGTDVYQIGETFGNYDLVSSYVNNGQLSAQFNFELYNAAQAVFIDPERSFKDLDIEMNKTFEVYGPLHFMGNIMDSHDKNRFIAYADGDIDLSQWSAIELGWENPPVVDKMSSYKKAELYYAYMLTVPGLPVIYYGSEFGMTGASDPDNRRMMRFNEQLTAGEKSMLENVKELVNMRRLHSSLRYGDYYTLMADENVYAYLRSDFYESVLIMLNKKQDSQLVKIKIPDLINVKNAIDLTDKLPVQIVNNEIEINLHGFGYKFIKIEK